MNKSIEKFRKNKKAFTIGDLGNIAIAFGVAIIILTVVAVIVQKLRDDQTDANTAARNATDFGLDALNTLSSFMPLVALTAIGAIVIGIVIRFFLQRQQQ